MLIASVAAKVSAYYHVYTLGGWGGGGGELIVSCCFFLLFFFVVVVFGCTNCVSHCINLVFFSPLSVMPSQLEPLQLAGHFHE